MIKILFSNSGRRTYLIDYCFELIKKGYKLDIYASDTSYVTSSFFANQKVKKIITPEVISTLETSKLDPTVSENLSYLKDVLKEDKMATGYHLEIRARFKPPIIPFSLNANLRYNFMQDFIQDVGSYLSMSAGLAFAI